MPTDIRFKPRASRIKKTIDAFLAAATGCLVLVAISLATLIFVEIQVLSWRVGEIDGGIPSELEVKVKPR